MSDDYWDLSPQPQQQPERTKQPYVEPGQSNLTKQEALAIELQGGQLINDGNIAGYQELRATYPELDWQYHDDRVRRYSQAT